MLIIDDFFIQCLACFYTNETSDNCLSDYICVHIVQILSRFGTFSSQHTVEDIMVKQYVVIEILRQSSRRTIVRHEFARTRRELADSSRFHDESFSTRSKYSANNCSPQTIVRREQVCLKLRVRVRVRVRVYPYRNLRGVNFVYAA